MKLAKPLLAMLDGQSALILDIGVGGAFVEHYGAVKSGDKFRLSFKWKGQDITFGCAVRRTTIVRPADDKQSAVSHTGVEFVEKIGDSAAKLQDMMGEYVGRVLAAQKANAAAEEGVRTSMLEHMGDARRARTKGFLAYLWDGKAWTCRRTQLGQQPRNGFTVAAYEEEEDLEVLCRAYESADEEGRALIKLVAELSVSSAVK